jgi:hypothetical protein
MFQDADRHGTNGSGYWSGNLVRGLSRLQAIQTDLTFHWCSPAMAKALPTLNLEVA